MQYVSTLAEKLVYMRLGVVPQEFVLERERKRLAAVRRREKYLRRIAAGETVRTIAAAEGISTQAVYKVLARVP